MTRGVQPYTDDTAAMLESERWVRWALGASPPESIEDAARRVLDGDASGVQQPTGAFLTASALLSAPMRDPWERIHHAARVAQRECKPRLVRAVEPSSEGEK